MISFSLLGQRGNLGNQLMQLWSMLGFAKKYACDLQIPVWKYAPYFKNVPRQVAKPSFTKRIKEPHYHYTPEYWDGYAEDFRSGKVDIEGWLQSWKYWEDAKQEIKERFAFEEKFKAGVRAKFAEVFTKETIAISVRRGDFVLNKNYAQLPITYYLLALFEHFPHWRECNLLLFSDELSYCHVHFDCLENAYFADGCNDIEQLCLLSMCDHFILANSTFSYCGAYLGEKEGSVVVRPAQILDGELKKNSDTKDHYPPHWKVFDHLTPSGDLKKLDLQDLTFTIPASFDSNDRRQNLALSVCLLQRNFHTNIIIGEQGSDKFCFMAKYCAYRHFGEMKAFHRTAMLNRLAQQADTPFVCNYDADVLLPPMQIWEAVERLRAGVDMCYPYDGRFARCARKPWFGKFEKYLDVGVAGKTPFEGTRPGDALSVGGCILFNRESFFEGGGENENYISYGNEDVERLFRFKKLDYKVERVPGKLFHIDHFVGINSTNRHAHGKSNQAEWQRISSMTKEQLQTYVETWAWAKTTEYAK